MPTIDVTDAAERLLGYRDIIRSHCLMYVSRAIRNGAPPLNWAGLTTAWNCWQFNAGDKHTSRNVPRGFPAFLGVKRGNTDGDVIISRGDGTFAATDHPWGQVGICTLAERETETGRKFVGWAGELFGYTLTSTGTASLDVTPIEEDDMNETQAGQLDALYKAVFGPNNGASPTTQPLVWANVDGDAQSVKYGLLPITINNQNLIARLITEQAALSAAVNAISTGNVDVAAVTAAARAGAEAALADLHIPTSGTITLK